MRVAWFDSIDATQPVITAEALLRAEGSPILKADPQTVAVTFHTRSALRYLDSSGIRRPLGRLPRFLGPTDLGCVADPARVWLLEGGFGAPAAVDTLEVLRACGVRQLLMVGLCGGLAAGAKVGDIIVPDAVLREEGTSYHYVAAAHDAIPDAGLKAGLSARLRSSGLDFCGGRTVSTDAPYRQTLRTESTWRDDGVIGVDMEASAVLAVAHALGVAAAAVLVVSDVHDPDGRVGWEWRSAEFRPVLERTVDAVVEHAIELSQR